MDRNFERAFVALLRQRLKGSNPLIQVLVGPRQVGKTTGVTQMIQKLKQPVTYASADDVLHSSRAWLLEQWQKALLVGKGSILVLDEIQKVPNWSETIKKLWDEKKGIKLVLLGSSPLLIQKGLSESLTGRFELIPIHHWGFHELKKAFGISFDDFLWCGGYPGSYAFIKDFDRWYQYIKDSIIETVIGKDILNFSRVAKPALFRQSFEIFSEYPAQEISYTKLLGQLQEKGNTDLVKHYLELFQSGFLFRALFKFSNKAHLSKGSTPKILPLSACFYSLAKGPEVLKDPEKKGRLFEMAVGQVLHRLPGNLYYWREAQNQVDYVYEYAHQLFAIEAKSGRKKSTKGLEVFSETFPKAHPVIIDPDNFEKFDQNPAQFLAKLS